MKKTIFIALVLVVFTSCNEQQVDKKSEGDKLMQTSRQWSQAAATKNVDSILHYWSDDAIVLSPGEQPLTGKQNIKKMVEGSFTSPGFQISWEPESAEVSESGDLGYLLENTRMVMPDSAGNTTTLNFKAVTIWKKQSDGSWKCVVDVLSPLQ